MIQKPAANCLLYFPKPPEGIKNDCRAGATKTQLLTMPRWLRRYKLSKNYERVHQWVGVCFFVSRSE